MILDRCCPTPAPIPTPTLIIIVVLVPLPPPRLSKCPDLIVACLLSDFVRRNEPLHGGAAQVHRWAVPEGAWQRRRGREFRI